MLGRTHITLGIASSLLITHPQTVPGVLVDITGGSLGGWIVDVDLKNRNVELEDDRKRENIYDGIIDALFISAFIVLDFLVGKGICRYITENWGIKIWGALFAFIILLLIGLNTKHRTFTHSFLGMALFCTSMYFLCKPVFIPFSIGYASHMIADMFNKLGLQLFYPLKWRPCLKVCQSNKKANKILFWISLAVDMAAGAYFFVAALPKGGDFSELVTALQTVKLFGLNALQLYLIFINVITFLGFERNFNKFFANIAEAYERGEAYDEEGNETPESRFEVWVLDFLVFIGGGMGMLLSLIKQFAYPAAYNGNWWSFCYTSIVFWFTVYCYICNPFGFEIGKANWLSAKHIPLLVYVIGINLISALYLYTIRKKKFSEYNIRHTLILLLGALGGTIGAIPTVIATHHEGKYFYVTSGFFVMMVSQIVFIIYMMMAGVF